MGSKQPSLLASPPHPSLKAPYPNYPHQSNSTSASFQSSTSATRRRSLAQDPTPTNCNLVSYNFQSYSRSSSRLHRYSKTGSSLSSACCSCSSFFSAFSSPLNCSSHMIHYSKSVSSSTCLHSTQDPKRTVKYS